MWRSMRQGCTHDPPVGAVVGGGWIAEHGPVAMRASGPREASSSISSWRRRAATIGGVGVQLHRRQGDRGIVRHRARHPSVKARPAPALVRYLRDLVYHHGACFRNPLSRVDASMTPPRYLAPLRLLRLRQLARRNRRLSEEVYERIERDEGFFAEPS